MLMANSKSAILEMVYGILLQDARVAPGITSFLINLRLKTQPRNLKIRMIQTETEDMTPGTA